MKNSRAGTMKSRTVGIVGGGLSSLSGAIRLAHLGFQVKLFEKNDTVGGKMNQVTENGFQFDTGPSLLTMPFIIDELFNFVGEKREKSLEFIPIDPICKYFFSDRSEFQAYANNDKMFKEFNRLFPQEKKAYIQFLKYAEKIFNTSAEFFLFTPYHELKNLLTPKIIPLLLKFYRIDPFRTVNQAINSYFSDPRLIQLFNRYATYNGSNPFTAPATLNIISYVEYVLGGYYIQGGMYRLVEKLSDLAISLGVEIHTSAQVEKIEYVNQKVTGLVVNGEFIHCDYILCGADVVESFANLIEGHTKTSNNLKAIEPSLSGLVFLWGIKGKHVRLKHHNIFFSQDYQKEFSQIFDSLQAPEDPTSYISITSKNDPSHAPRGCENWFVLLNMPYLNGKIDWKKEPQKIKKRLLNKLKQHGLNVKSLILYEKIITPEDISNIYGSNKGSIYGISSNSRMTAFKRSANRNRQIKNLYFAGGSVHPGGGIPMVLLSGKMASELIATKEGINRDKTGSFKKYMEMHPKINLNEYGIKYLTD
jgi:phytoene desaturase